MVMGTETVHLYINSHTYKSVLAIVLIKHCFYKINRGDEKAFGEAFYRCSYLAKARGKGYSSLGTNNYSGSRVRFKSSVLNIKSILL